MKTLLLIACIALTGCTTPKGTTTAPLVAALQKAKASTDQAIEDKWRIVCAQASRAPSKKH